METKTCKGECGEEHPLIEEFWYRRKSGRFNTTCKTCEKKRLLERHRKNRENPAFVQENKKRERKRYLSNQEFYKKRSRDRYRNDPEAREKDKENSKLYFQNNRDKIRVRRKENMENNPSAKIAARMRGRILRGLKAQSAEKKHRSIDYLGCTIEELVEHLEGQFQEGMGWNNYGNPNGDHTECWHVDHIRPCVSFDLTDEDQQRVCFHYSNLQPLWAKDNLSKGGKYEPEQRD